MSRLHYRIPSCIIVLMSLFAVIPQCLSKELSNDEPIVKLWVPWNDIALRPQEIEQIPEEKINWVTLSFYPPLRDMDKIRHAIELFHKKGIKVEAFITMEFNVDSFLNVAKKRGEIVPPGLVFKPALNADGSQVPKFGKAKIPVPSFWDPVYRKYMEDKIRFIKDCGADYISCGEAGYMTSDIRDFTEESLKQFQKETGLKLPTVKLSAELKRFMDTKGPREKWYYWKYKKFYDWLYTLPVDSMGRYLNDRGLYSPEFKRNRYESIPGISIGPRATESMSDYPKLEEIIKNYPKNPNKKYLGGIQFSVGNTGANIKHPERIYHHALFLAQRLDGFGFYASSYWRRYKLFAKYLPDLKDYRKLCSTYDYNKELARLKKSGNIPVNLVKNPSFEKTNAAWLPFSWHIPPGCFGKLIFIDHSSGNAFSGKKSLRLEPDGVKDLYIESEKFKVLENMSYNLSFCVRAESLTSKAVSGLPQISISWFDKNDRKIKRTVMRGIPDAQPIAPGTYWWIKILKTLQSPAAADAAVVSIRIPASSGLIWVDDIEFKIAD